VGHSWGRRAPVSPQKSRHEAKLAAAAQRLRLTLARDQVTRHGQGDDLHRNNPLFRLPMTFVEIFPVGLLIALVSAGLLRNPRFLPARQRSGAMSPG